MDINAVNSLDNSGASQYNALSFLINSLIDGRVNTMTPVKVVSVDSGGSGSVTGYVDVQPLLTQKDANGNMIAVSELYKLPYCRIQGGKVAIVADPVAGDTGIAIFAQQDSQNITSDTSEPILPATYTPFPLNSGWYVGGFLNQAPSVYLELTQDDTAILHAPTKIRLESPVIELTGQLVQTAEESSEASVMLGGFTNTGGTITSNGITLETHTHTGDSGGTTSAPL